MAFRTRKTRLLHVPISAPMMGLQDLATASDRALEDVCLIFDPRSCPGIHWGHGETRFPCQQVP